MLKSIDGRNNQSLLGFVFLEIKFKPLSSLSFIIPLMTYMLMYFLANYDSSVRFKFFQIIA